MGTDLIYPLIALIPVMTIILGLLGPLRRAVTRWGEFQGLSAAEREAQAAIDLADVEADRHELEVRRGTLAEEVAREKARLTADTARLEVDADAARQCLPEAVEARQVALKARAEAEAALAPEAARKALETSDGEIMTALQGAYSAYCDAHPGIPWTFGQWVQGFNGVPRG